MLIELLLTFAYAILFFPAVYLTGSVATPFLNSLDQKMKGIVIYALGLGMFSYYAVAVGHLKMFFAPWFFAFLAMVYLLGWKRLLDFQGWCVALWVFLMQGKGFLYRASLGAFLISFFLTLAMCFIPETANDALCYQLNLPKIFVTDHSTRPIFYDLNSYMPLLMQHLYAVALLFESVPLAKLCHWSTGILLFFAVFLTTYHVTQRKLLALFCALMLWLTPTSMNQIATTYVDVAVTFFLFIGIWTLWEALKIKNIPLSFLGGVFFGFVVSAKLIAGLWAGIFFLLFTAVLIRQEPWDRALKMFFGGLAGGILACGFWFLRNWLLENNPVFPYLGNVFGDLDAELVGSYIKMGLPKTLKNYLLLPWNLTFLPDVFDRGHWVGPFYLLALPAALLGALKNNMARFCLVMSFFAITAWFFIAPNSRFLLPVLPVYLIAVAIGLDILEKNSFALSKLCMRWIAAALILFLLILSLHHFRYPLRAFIERWDSNTYLSKIERSYQLAEWINLNLPEDAQILNAQEVRQFYFKREMVRDIWFRIRTRYDKKIDDKDLIAYLKSKRFTHVLRAYPDRGGDSLSDYDKLDGALSDPGKAALLFEMRSKNIREFQCKYRVYELL